MALKQQLPKIPLGLWLVVPIALGILLLLLAKFAVSTTDPTQSYALTIVVLTLGGVAQAILSLVAKNWVAFMAYAVSAHAVLFVLLLTVGTHYYSEAGAALMALMMPILFPALAFVAAGVVRLLGNALGSALRK